jgi:redox-sensitive bicupin YhaK (pirin superfamily)
MEREIVRVHGVTKRGPSEQVNDKQIVLQAGNYLQTTPFLTLSEDWFAAPRGFETHPHRGMQTVTFVLDGALEHKDHTGGHGVLHTGDVQLWLNLPAKMKMTAARYVNQHAADVPVRKEDGVEVRVYAGRSGKAEHPHGSNWPMMLLDIRMEPRKFLFQEIPSMYRGFAYVLEGSARLGAEGTPVTASHVAWFDPSLGDGDDTLTIASDEKNVRLLLFAAPPIQEPVAFGGPFVMNTQEEIQQAFADYRSGKFLAG